MFLCRTKAFTVPNHMRLGFHEHYTNVDFSSGTETSLLSLRIRCRKLEWQLSSLSQVCNSVLLVLSALGMEYLNLGPNFSRAYPLPIKLDDMDNTQWLEILHPFANVKDLHLSEEVSTWIAPALQELAGEQVTEILPTLQNIFLDSVYSEHEPVPKAIWEFVAARQLSGYPVAIHRRHWDLKSGTWVEIED